PVPGPSAVAAALSASGLPTHRFLFAGFPPPKTGGLRKLLQSLQREQATLVFYLPTRRILEFLAAVLATLGDRRVVIARELTKIHEEFIRGAAADLVISLEKRPLKGEATVLVEGLR
ncbi:MAG: SAM-dependent methyltransferase, partial [Candidatus Aminicenantales bacterium]